MIAERLENKNSGEPAAEGVVHYASWQSTNGRV